MWGNFCWCGTSHKNVLLMSFTKGAGILSKFFLSNGLNYSVCTWEIFNPLSTQNIAGPGLHTFLKCKIYLESLGFFSGSLSNFSTSDCLNFLFFFLFSEGLFVLFHASRVLLNTREEEWKFYCSCYQRHY